MLSHMIRFFGSGFLIADIETDTAADNQDAAQSVSQTHGFLENQ